ncbi:MAG: 30S ribosomal protein S20 [Omnitrophica bacterium GWA2_41_15]|uniref:Small ribosomal subunit protein bS20 n=1 Tax=Candidatus Gottesmanbacteria bacterium GW2011_GWC2_39_8 TaxID=1618450 RepID=A0A0G0Q1S9_9BACT|nr:MAG: 30S ribosomal protein S20 [Candidatus Gottesmanbacteria bacterium GW2011_GWC2_39_8]OGW71894.1 MAG: 30S ribosomal protein S20 [Omnitrophica bacterium GWA2_41_15]HAZ10222.1 30S ribosomal protein S20 [Candidatus Omnitrophota bacterium]
MPILHASYKDIKKSAKKALRNQSAQSELKTETKKFIELVSSKKMEEAKIQLNYLISQLDKAKSKGIIHKNTASRKIARLTRKLNVTSESRTALA